jgi:geranylgeranyl pyrophosphate synthase
MDSDSEILDKYSEHITKINKELKKALSSRVTLAEDIGRHTLLGHGKRLRPLFFVLSCQLCNYQGIETHIVFRPSLNISMPPPCSMMTLWIMLKTDEIDLRPIMSGEIMRRC